MEYVLNKNRFDEQQRKGDWSPLYEDLKKFETYDETYYKLHNTTMELIEKYARLHPEEFLKTKWFPIFVTERLHMRRDVFQAIADPTRRDILGLLANESLTLNGIADNFHISRPAVSKHIKILTECGLVIIKPQGRERYCEVQMEPLQEVNLWVQQYRRFWTQKFDSLEKFLSAPATTIKKRKK